MEGERVLYAVSGRPQVEIVTAHAENGGVRRAAFVEDGDLGLRVAAELEREGIVTLHNKGLVIDERFVVLGSMNGNHHSRSNNREAGLILEGPEVAAYYGALFQSDWVVSTPVDWGQVARDLKEVPASPWPILLALTAVARLGCFPRSRTLHLP